MMDLQLHPLCTLFPRMAGAEFSTLVDDIKANGQREPIILHDGMILDGGNRYRACIEAGIEPQTMKFGGGNIVDYVLSANLHRRHLSPGQQAAIVASMQDWATAHPASRPKAGNVTGLSTVASRSAASGASDKTQRNADKVAKANPELAIAVGHGEISLPKAVEQINGKRPGSTSKNAPPEQDDNEIEGLREANAEQGAAIKELLAENESLALISESDDKLRAALDELKKCREINRILEERVRGLQNECNEAKKAAKSWQAKFLKLEKQCKPT
jgi:hypothetical protein